MPGGAKRSGEHAEGEPTRIIAVTLAHIGCIAPGMHRFGTAVGTRMLHGIVSRHHPIG